LGGKGSGRFCSFETKKTENYIFLDVGLLNKNGCLHSGWNGCWSWKDESGKSYSISMNRNNFGVNLNYCLKVGEGEWEKVEQDISVIHIPCRFGGNRPYFICPGQFHPKHRSRKALKLYIIDRYFLCRHCHELKYSSQFESKWERQLRKANKYRLKVGGDTGLGSDFPDRPKGMWSKTYSGIFDKYNHAEMMVYLEFLSK